MVGRGRWIPTTIGTTCTRCDRPRGIGILVALVTAMSPQLAPTARIVRHRAAPSVRPPMSAAEADRLIRACLLPDERKLRHADTERNPTLR